MTEKELILPLGIQGQREFNIRMYYSNTPKYVRSLVDHFHPELEIQIIESGGGTYVYGGKEHSFQPRDIFFFRSNERHYSVERTDDARGGPSSSYGFYFMPEFLQHLDYNLFGTNYMNIFSSQNFGFINHIPADHYAAKQIYNLSREIIGEFEQKNTGHSTMITLHLINIIATYARSYNPNIIKKLQSQPKISKSNLHGIQAAMTYIDTHCADKLSLNELSSVANMSPAHFSVTFKKINGFSPWDYVSSCRISLAKQLLSNTDLTILDVATKCGFNNCSNFNRQFKKITTQTPSEYRSSHF